MSRPVRLLQLRYQLDKMTERATLQKEKREQVRSARLPAATTESARAHTLLVDDFNPQFSERR